MGPEPAAVRIGMPEILDLVLHGGNVGILIVVAWVLMKVNTRMNRDESLRADYPPHRHSNGHIIYPHEYQPTPIGRLNSHD